MKRASGRRAAGIFWDWRSSPPRSWRGQGRPRPRADVPPIWFDPTPWLARLCDAMFWGAIGLIGLIVLGAMVVPAALRLIRWNR